jgi:hypothetical protein
MARARAPVNRSPTLRSSGDRSSANKARKPGPGGDLPRGDYGLVNAPGMMFKPFFQFISHPDQASATRPSGNNAHAIFVGALFEVDVAQLFGLPTLGS